MSHSDSRKKPAAIFLMGPTASGKTGLASFLLRALPVEIISVDASQVYRGMDVGTAKPTPEELVQTPHHLIDIRDPADTYSAADFCADARALMDKISAAGRIPLLVGGSMFYFKALEFGLTDLPEADPEVRTRIEQEAAQLGWPALYERLVAADPATAARIHPNDPQRLERALEILELSGRPPSEIMAEQQLDPLPYRLIKTALVPPDREKLREEIALRFHAMLNRGLVDEVRGLMDRGDLGPEMPALRMVGYRQVWSYLKGELDYSEMIRQAITATRQLAKRQLTWLRHYPDVENFDSTDTSLKTTIMAHFRERLGMMNG